LADRFAEALQNICTKNTQIWGYSADEVLTAEGMIAEEYKGSPTPGYPLS
jgi:cobalamin-dependent methionine synthase I